MVSLIIVEYCSIEKTIRYIENLIENSIGDTQIHPIIVDNSPNSQIKELERIGYKTLELYSLEDNIVSKMGNGVNEIIYYFSNDNLGYARGNNIGTIISDSLFSDDYYIISNNDIRIDNTLQFGLFKKIFDRNPEIAVIGPKVIGLDGKVQSPHKKISAFKRLILYYWLCRWPFRWKPDYDYDGKSKFCYRVMGSFMIIRAQAFREVGRFDGKTFMYFEEPILSERLLKYGYKTYFYNDYTVVHEHGATVEKIGSATRSEQWAFDSGCYYYKKYRNTGNFLLFIARINFQIYLLRLRLQDCIKKLFFSRI